MRYSEIRTRVVALALSGGLLACQADQPSAPISAAQAQLPEESAALQAALDNAVDIAGFNVDLPDVPNEWEVSDSALVDAVAKAGGLAFVGFKSASGARIKDQRRRITDVMGAPGRTVVQGRRGALSKSDAQAALRTVSASGAVIHRYYEHLGVAYVSLPDPSRASALQRLPVVDYLEPDNAQIFVTAIARADDGPRRVISARNLTAGFRFGASALLAQTVPWGISLVRAPDAWPYSTGAGSTLLIVDTGHERGHSDLPLVPLGNCSGTYGGCDDPVQTPLTLPHGSHVAGIAAAIDNSFGVVGVAKGLPANNLYVAGACDSNYPFPCSIPEIAAALNWSVTGLGSSGVINMSLGGTTNSGTLAAAVAAAVSAGHVVVAAMGNAASSTPFYPAAYANVVSIGAILPDKSFAATAAPCVGQGGSNWGSHVDFVAPWYALSTVPQSAFADETQGWCGTSMATPHVAGLAVLLRTRYPSLSASSIYYKIRDTAEPLGPVGWDDHYGFGLIRAHLATAFERPVVSPTILSGKPRLTWPSVPFATEYRIYRRVTPSACPQWALWATRTTASYTDTSTPVTSFYGYDSQPAQTAVSYYVTAFADGVETVYYQYLTYLPTGAPVC
jgi:subtilisin